MNTEKKLSEEDLISVKDSQKNLQLSRAATKSAELEYENAILKLYLKYNLSMSDSIDLETGKITSHESTEKTQIEQDSTKV